MFECDSSYTPKLFDISKKPFLYAEVFESISYGQ